MLTYYISAEGVLHGAIFLATAADTDILLHKKSVRLLTRGPGPKGTHF